MNRRIDWHAVGLFLLDLYGWGIISICEKIADGRTAGPLRLGDNRRRDPGHPGQARRLVVAGNGREWQCKRRPNGLTWC
jgi:hypothetical protein